MIQVATDKRENSTYFQGWACGSVGRALKLVCMKLWAQSQCSKRPGMVTHTYNPTLQQNVVGNLVNVFTVRVDQL